jgi:hypothetical protein
MPSARFDQRLMPTAVADFSMLHATLPPMPAITPRRRPPGSAAADARGAATFDKTAAPARVSAVQDGGERKPAQRCGVAIEIIIDRRYTQANKR